MRERAGRAPWVAAAMLATADAALVAATIAVALLLVASPCGGLLVDFFKLRLAPLPERGHRRSTLRCAPRADRGPDRTARIRQFFVEPC